MIKLFRKVARNFRIFKQALGIRCRYRRHIVRLRGKGENEKIRILFIVSDIAKWKEQSLYEYMEQSGTFEPIVGITAWNGQSETYVPNDRLESLLSAAELFFKRLGNRYVRTVKIEGGRRIFSDLSEFVPDIVYYTEPWAPEENQKPEEVSRFALTCYSPYYVPNYSSLKEECRLPLHRFLWNYYCLGGWQAKCYERAYFPLKEFRASVKFIGTGHPALDYFQLNKDRAPVANTVIYAPHFSIKGEVPWLHHYATFRWSGKFMLEYAKSHPEIRWAFKPHPLLKTGIRKARLMTDEEIDSYYEEWRKIAVVCEDADYQNLFLDSVAMITDCGSFLSEYGATRRPVIHLISSDNTYQPISLLAGLYDTYYKAHDLDGLKAMLASVIERGEDPMRERRVAALMKTGLTGGSASENIVRHLCEILKRK